ncbi:MAG TPA: fatty acid--CoA ligase family protein, partial [Mycobacterium sp.]|nr:fatty acid--CoA ligase family protein [Mycobacterium sp.]
GRPHQGIEIRILDDAGADLAPGQVGEIWIHSPFATRDASVSERLDDGYLRTGDIGHLDSDGFLWLEGRASDMINRGGLKVLPQEIEEHLCARPEVAEACVAGVPDRRLGEVPVAWVRATPGVSVDLTALLADLRDTFAGYKIPVSVEVISELPRNEIGKVLRRSLVEQWIARGDKDREETT